MGNGEEGGAGASHRCIPGRPPWSLDLSDHVVHSLSLALHSIYIQNVFPTRPAFVPSALHALMALP